MIEPPLFVLCEDGDVLMFRSAESLISYAESPDVESGEYVSAFDATGRRLALEVPVPTKRNKLLGIEMIGLTPVVVRPLDEVRPDVLAKLLSERLGSNAADLPALVEQALETWRFA